MATVEIQDGIDRHQEGNGPLSNLKDNKNDRTYQKGMEWVKQN